jgi:hypothetical protein
VIEASILLVVLRTRRPIGALIGRPIATILRRSRSLRPGAVIEVAVFLRTALFTWLIVIATVVHVPARLIVLRSTAIVGALLLPGFEGAILARRPRSLVPVKAAIVRTARTTALIVSRWSLAIVAIEAALVRPALTVAIRPRRRTRSIVAVRTTIVAWRQPLAVISQWRTLPIIAIKPLAISRRWSLAIVALWRSLAVVTIETALLALWRSLPIVPLRRALAIVTIEALTIALWRTLAIVAIEAALFARSSIGRLRLLGFLILVREEIALWIEATLSSLFLLRRLPIAARWLSRSRLISLQHARFSRSGRS